MRSVARSFLIMAVAVAISCGTSLAQKNKKEQRSAATADMPSHVVGILPFQDLSGGDSGSEINDALAKKLQAALLNASNLMPKFMKPGGDGESAIDLQYAIKLGRHYKTDIAVMGSLLSAEVEEGGNSFSGPSFGGVSLSGSGRSQSATVILQAELIDVGRGQKITSFRVTGKDRQSKVSPSVGTDYGSMDLSGSDFARSALGKATQQAIDQMSSKIINLAAEFRSVATGSGETGQTAAGDCAVIFRVVGPDMQPIDDFTIAIAGNDMSSQIKDGVLRFNSPGQGAVIQVTIKNAPEGTKTQPVYVGNVDSSCGKQSEKVLALELQGDGSGKFSWWQ